MVERDKNRKPEMSSYPSFTDIMADLNARYQLGLSEKTLVMARAGEASMRVTRDGAHNGDHYQHMGFDTALVLRRYPELREKIDWNTYVAAVSFHDEWRAHLPPNPWNLWKGRNQESRYAPGPAVSYMKAHGFSKEEIGRVTYLIRVHPYRLDDPRRTVLEKTVDETLKTTGRFLYIIDSLDQFRINRINEILAYISKSLGGMSPKLFYKQFVTSYKRLTNDSFDLGPDFPWVREEAVRRRAEALRHIHKVNVSGQHRVG